MKVKLMPRAPLTTDRRTGGAHRVRRELSAREELTLRLNELAQGDYAFDQLDEVLADHISTHDDGEPTDPQEEDYYAYLLSKLETIGGGEY